MVFIEAENYQFYYPEQIEAAISIEHCRIYQGAVCLIAGPSGCGKTTFLRQLAGISGIQGEQKGILVNHAKETAYVWQDIENQIVTDTVRYEILFGMENKGMPQNQMKRRLAEVVTAFGLEELAGRNTMDLSGGEKQLLNVASSLAMNPDLIILDEPTSQLDPVAAVRLFDLLRRINEELGVTILIAEQRLEDLVPLADQMICMEAGEIVADGRPCDVLSKVFSTESESLFPAYMRMAPGILTKKDARLWFESHYQAREETACAKKSLCGNRRTESVVIKKLCFRYEKKGKNILNECSAILPAGKTTCLLGGNGSGKTTLLRLLDRQIYACRGKILPDSVRTSYLPQNPVWLFLEESVQAECAVMTEQGQKLVNRFGLSRMMHRHPLDLSGGEKQRLALAHVLGKEAEMYLLDEPTKGLDAKMKCILGEVIGSLAVKGKTVLIVSHDMEFIAHYADQICFLYEGQIVVQTDTRDFFEENQYYTTSINRVARRVSPHIITIEDVEHYAEKSN